MTSSSLPDNPYASPRAIGTETPTSDAEAIRMAHLSHEASVRSIGSLYYLGGILTAITLVSLLVVGVTGGDTFGPGDVFGFAILFGMLTISFGIGRGLRTLRRSAQIFAGLISTLGLLAFPIGTLINGYILCLLFSSKGNRVFSAEYKEIIEQTPHVVYRQSTLLAVLAVILLLLLLTGFVSFLVIS
jgi:hypothetical protein